MNHTIQYACRELGLTVHTVRYYCDCGLVPGLRHDANGNRIFDDAALNWLRAVTFLRAGGLSIAGIRRYFALCQQGRATLEERCRILQELRSAAEKQRAEAQARMDCLDKTICAVRAAQASGADECNPMNW